MVLQHNVRSLLCNISETKLLLQTLHDKNSTVDIMMLCETFLARTQLNQLKYLAIHWCRTIKRIIKGEAHQC